MGAQIAAHFANAGVPVLLLDVTADAAATGLQRARTLKPDPFFTPETWKLITTGGFDESLPRIRDADWVLEAVVEQLEIKRQLLAKVDQSRRPGTVVSSNTSAISIAALADGRRTVEGLIEGVTATLDETRGSLGTIVALEGVGRAGSVRRRA